MNIIEQAKARKAVEEAAKITPESAAKVATVSPTDVPVARTEANMNQIAPSGLATGMASSLDSVVQHPSNVSNGTLGQAAPVSGIDPDLVPAGAYIALNLNQFTLPNGKLVKPVNGVYDPSTLGKDQEAAEIELAHFATMYGLVQKKD